MKLFRADRRGADADVDHVGLGVAGRAEVDLEAREDHALGALVVDRPVEHVQRGEVLDARLLDVGGEDGVVDVPHRVEVAEAHVLAVHEGVAVHPGDASGCHSRQELARSRSGLSPTASFQPSFVRAQASVSRDRLGERPEREAGGARARDVGLLHVRPLGVALGDPERQLHPLADLALEQERLVHPGERSASLPPTARQVSSTSPIVSPSRVALKAPLVRCSATVTSQAPRSRASTNSTGRPGRPGASTSPPRATRTGQ